MLRVDQGALAPEHGIYTDVGWAGCAEAGATYDEALQQQAAGALSPSSSPGQDAGNQMSAAQSDVKSGIGEARLGGYPHGRILIGAGARKPPQGMVAAGKWPARSPGAEAAQREMLPGQGDASMLPMSLEVNSVPFLAVEMNSVLLYVLYSISAAEVDEHGPTLVRLVFLALSVQICIDYHAQMLLGGGGAAAASAMEEDAPADDDTQSLEALILAEIRQLDLPAAVAQVSSAAASAHARGFAAQADTAELGSLESYFHRCSLPFLRRARFLLSVHSGDTLPAAAAASLGAASLRDEWRAAMAALQLPVGDGACVPLVGEYCKGLVRGWLRELAPLRTDARGAATYWPMLLKAFPRPQDLGFPVLIPLPDLYHDLYMTYRHALLRPCLVLLRAMCEEGGDWQQPHCLLFLAPSCMRSC
jgi:hypothetical protein